MAQYLIEFRFQSKKIRSYLKSMIYELNRKFNVGKKKHIPHITLVGPLTTDNEKRLIADFARVCSQTPLMKFKMRGFGTFDNAGVVFVNIGASENLNKFRVNLTNTLRTYCKVQSQDKREDKDKFGYHSTLAMKLDAHKFNLISNYINSKPKPDFTQIVMRITLLRNGKILREYDFMQRKLLGRGQALNRRVTGRSKFLLQQFMKGQYNPISNNHQVHPVNPPQQKSFLNKILSFFK